jgi:hypothetical protein
MSDEYEEQANAFLKKFGFKMKVVMTGNKCPPWEKAGDGCVHGDRYVITISASDGRTPKSISFDFWNSLNDMQTRKAPTEYTVLACISSEANSPTDPDEVAKEFGDMLPSQAIAVAKFAKKLQNFFTEKEIEALSEIQ